ncbi:uncharacterized [Tachysurus ichikawai]
MMGEEEPFLLSSKHSYSWLKGTKSIEDVIWFHFTSFSKALGLSLWDPLVGQSNSETTEAPAPTLHLTRYSRDLLLFCPNTAGLCY